MYLQNLNICELSNGSTVINNYTFMFQHCGDLVLNSKRLLQQENYKDWTPTRDGNGGKPFFTFVILFWVT